MVKKNLNSFLSAEENTMVVEAIRDAERMTSGEIRVHLAGRVNADIYKEAVRLFNKLKMYRTSQRNGCLILVDVAGRKVAIIGDSGINERVPSGFWNDVVEAVIAGFAAQQPAAGLVSGIALIGEKLKTFFPYHHGDVNELSDEISVS